MNLFENFRSQNRGESTGKRREYEQEMKQTLQKIKEHHSRKQKPNDAFALRCFIPSSTFRDSFPTRSSTTTGLALVYETQVSGENSEE